VARESGVRRTDAVFASIGVSSRTDRLQTGLLEDLPGACGLDAPRIAQQLQRKISVRLEKWFARIQPQVVPLTRALVERHQQVLRLKQQGETIVLLEFPIGNSLLTRMLCELLSGRSRGRLRFRHGAVFGAA